MRNIHPLRQLTVAVAAFAVALTAHAQGVIDEWDHVKPPPAPQVVPVTLDPKTTALLLIDMIRQTCNPQKRPRCVAIVPNIQKLLEEARRKGVFVVYTLFPSPSPATFPDPKISDYVPELAPVASEPVVTAFVDKFSLAGRDTGLQHLLEEHGIKTVIPVGVASHNGVLFTAVSAALRGFRVVVPVDGMAGNNAYEDQAADYILSSSMVYKVTLTSVDLIKFSQ